MNDPKPAESAAPAALPPTADQGAAPEAVVDPSKLTPEEQMALYEKNLKETDWGHQPC